MNPSQNNSFGMQNGPIVSGGDVALPTVGSGSGGKRGLIVAGVVAAILAIVFGVAAVLMSNQNGAGNNTSLDYVARYNEYANYIINGNRTTNGVSGEYDDDTMYYIDNVASDSDRAKQKEYFDAAWQLWQAFEEDYSETDYSKNENLVVNKYIEMMGQNLDFVVKYFGVENDYSKQAEVLRDFLGLSATETVYKYEIIEALQSAYGSIGRYAFSISGLIGDPESKKVELEVEESGND